MRSRWLLVAGGVLLAAGVLFLFPKRGRVSIQVLGETNRYRTVVVTNGTAQLYLVTAWGEFYANDAWERLSLSNTYHQIEPGKFIATEILMHTNGPKCVVFIYSPVKTSGLGGWINRAKARLRIKPSVETEYIEVE